MLNHLTGRLLASEPTRAVVECGGVGFLLRVPASTFEKLPAPGAECTLLTHLHVREDALELFGFLTEAERRLFKKLITVSGVGPNVAMALMSRCSIADVVSAVKRGDALPLTRAKGVGRKTAERIVLDLKSAAAELEALVGGVPETPRGAEGLESSAAQALVTLGYSEDEARRAAHEAARDLGETVPLGEAIRESLRRVRS